MTVIIDGGSGVTFPDAVQQTNGVTMTGGDPKYYAARAWVNFNGTGTVAIRAATNVSSITDSGVGLYDVNFTQAMPDSNYVCAANSAVSTVAAGGFAVQPTNTSSSICRLRTLDASTTADAQFVYAAFFR